MPLTLSDLDSKNVCIALTFAIILVLVLIMIVMHDINKLEGFKSESFKDEKEKLNRANEVLNAVGGQLQDNPKASFDSLKSYLPDLNAVEFKDVRNAAISNDTLTPQSLAAMW